MRALARHCERSEAIQLACARIWIASSLSLLAMTSVRLSHLSPPAGRGRGSEATEGEGPLRDSERSGWRNGAADFWP
jgi:hypothetical protein